MREQEAACAEWHTPYADQILHALFEQPVGAQNYVSEFPCIGWVFRLLFQPTSTVLDALHAERQPEERKPVVGLHFRAGDIAMLPGESDNRGRSFDACLRLAVSISGNSSLVYVVSDSVATKEIARKEAGVLVSRTIPFHVDKSTYDRERVLEVFVDLFMLASMDSIVITPSGFGALAALISNRAPQSIHYC